MMSFPNGVAALAAFVALAGVLWYLLRQYRLGRRIKVPSIIFVPRDSEPRRVPWREADGSDSNSSTVTHGRNFLDCVRSRNKPVSDLEIGFYASLPCLLAVKAVREGRSFKWDDAAKKAVAV